MTPAKNPNYVFRGWFHFFPAVRDQLHQTAGATDAGSIATKHSVCQRVGVRWIAWFDLFY